MKVLSLFDGISCGMVALERAGIPIEEYVAYEIDPNAIKVSEKNYPNIIHKGDVCNATYNEGDFDLLIGGSPCQDLSGANQKGEGLNGKRSGLFWEYVRALKEVKPKYFFFENVASMKEKDKEVITSILGVEPIFINSSLVSAQCRKRFYWTNIPNISIPQDKLIMLKDVIEDEAVVSVALRTRKDYIGSSKHLEARKDGKANSLTTVYTDSMLCSPIRIGDLYPNKAQAGRIYSVRGKSVALQAEAGGVGAKTGLYRIDLPDGDYVVRKLSEIECERLQTLPDNYTKAEKLSWSKRVKLIGNGWTVDVIAHIFQGLKNG